MKIAVVGAGIIGMLTAYELGRRGHQVKVFDREDQPAMKCSHANGAQISVCNSQTWHTWSNVGKGLKWMLQEDAPLFIRPSFSKAKAKWLAGFLKHTINGSHIKNTLETIKLGKASSTIYDQIIAREGLQFDQSKCGLLHVYTKEQSLVTAEGHRALFEDNGVEWRTVTRAEVLSIDPALSTFKDLQGGIMTSSDWTGDAFLFCNELRKICERKYSVRFFFNTEVERVKYGALFYRTRKIPMAESFDRVVICNGHEIVKFASVLGDDLNVFPVKGYSITVENVGNTAPHISILDDDRKIVSSRLGNRLRVSGTAELDGDNDSVRPERIAPLLNWVKRNFPDVSLEKYSEWACLRPMNASMMPIIKQSKDERVFYHGGHGHLGWTLGAGTTRLLLDFMRVS